MCVFAYAGSYMATVQMQTPTPNMKKISKKADMQITQDVFLSGRHSNWCSIFDFSTKLTYGKISCIHISVTLHTLNPKCSSTFYKQTWKRNVPNISHIQNKTKFIFSWYMKMRICFSKSITFAKHHSHTFYWQIWKRWFLILST